MMVDRKRSELVFYGGVIAAVVLGLYLSSLYSYLLFHVFVEIVTIIIAFSCFILTWNTRAYLENGYLRLLGIGYVFIASIDLLHTFAYKGMTVFPGYGANLPTQLWIAARYLQAVTLLAAPLVLERKVDNHAVFGGYAAAVAALVIMIFTGNFPDCFIEGKGLTLFKIGSEYVISAALLASLYLLSRKKKHFSDRVYYLIISSIVCTVLSELSFTAYVSVYGFANLVGHFAKLAAFYLIYRALLVTGLKDPFELVFRDLKQAEDALRKSRETLEDKVRDRTSELQASEERYRTLIMKVQTAIVLHDGKGRILSSNPLAQDLLGLSRDRLVGMDLIDREWHFLREEGSIMPVEEYPVSIVLSGRGPLRNYIVGISRPDRKTVTWAMVNAEPEFDDTGEITRVIVSFVDITESKRAEETLRERESFIRNILDSVDEGFIVVDREYGIVSANRAFCDFMKLPEDRIVGRSCYRITHGLDRPCFESGEDCAVRRTFETGEAHTSFHTHELEDGGKQYVEIKSYPITDAGGRVVSAIETVNDVTERRKLEEQLRQAQKMKAVGTLAGGIAHDFNNILTAIIGYGNIMKMKMRPDDPLLPSIDQILASSDRAAHLTQGLLAFSRKQVLNPRPVDMNDIVRNVEKLLRRIIGEDISLSTELSGTSLIAMADSVQIEQVLMNFATNARDAMPHGGTLTISTRGVELGEDFVAMHGFGKPGSYALIAVSDTGEGMDERTREHIFDPFYTTKEPGKGTGLGLAIVYGIVKQHNGNINVYSEPGKGTTFKIYLPLIEKPVETAAEEPAAAPRGGTETVLLAEDDREVRKLTAMVLKEYGYTVIEAVDGEDAVVQFKKRDKEIDLLLLDVIMPRKSGKEAYDAIKAIKPDVAALFISGYTADIMHRKGISEEGLECISKPVSPFELMRKVREILNGKNVTSG